MSFVDRPWSRHAAIGAVVGMIAVVLHSGSGAVMDWLPSKLPETQLSAVLVGVVWSTLNVLLVPGNTIALAMGGTGAAAQWVLLPIVNPLIYAVTAAAIGGRLTRARAWRIGAASFWAVWLVIAAVMATAFSLMRPD